MRTRKFCAEMRITRPGREGTKEPQNKTGRVTQKTFSVLVGIFRNIPRLYEENSLLNSQVIPEEFRAVFL